MSTTVDVDIATSLESALRGRVRGEVRFDVGSRAAYAVDSSNYRQVPAAVVVPRSVEDAVTAVAVCAEYGVPITSRGGGTSLAGQTTNAGVVLDWTKYCNAVVSVDVEAVGASSSPASRSTTSTGPSPSTGSCTGRSRPPTAPARSAG